MAALGGTLKTACVTGGNGFVGSALVKLLLQRGYRVHATVRNAETMAKIAHLKALESLGELMLFPADLLVDGSFDEAVAGCDYVFHVASRATLEDTDDPEYSVIQPAVKGTLNVLRSCTKVGTLRRVILTSSIAAVVIKQLEATGLVLDESSWTDVDYVMKEKPPTWPYVVAKTLAEKEAWKYAEEHKLDLVVVNPVAITGYGLLPDPPHSVRLSLSLITGEEQLLFALRSLEKVTGSIMFVHIEDVCRAQLHVAEAELASGRYILSSVSISIQDLATFLSNRYPDHKIAFNKLGNLSLKPRCCTSSQKIIKEGFKFKYEKLEAIYDEIIEQSKATGLLHKTTELLI